MVKIKLRLVGEEENVIFPRIELDPQIQLYDLAKRIEWITWIPPVFQEVRFRSQDLPLVERPIQDIKFGEEIVVMHSDLPWWEQYKESADIALKPGCERLWQASEAVYIATKWEKNIIPLSGDPEEAVGVEVLVQIFLLGTFLFIDDLHTENCGYWKDTKEVAIVDFMPRAFFKFTNLKRASLNNNFSVCWETSHIDALEACDEATRMEITRKRLCLKQRDLLSKIDLAHEQITPVKNLMRRSERPAEELDQCISIIKQNIIKLNELLEANE